MRWILPILVLATTTPAIAQSKAEQFAAEFNKKKDQTKTKHGVTTRKFHEVVATPWTFSDNRRYDGEYASDIYNMRVDVTDTGVLNVSGSDGQGTFVLKNAVIDGGILTGMKSYGTGGSEPFKAIFLKRRDRVVPGEDFITSYGLGFIEERDDSTLRIFLVRR